MKYLSLAVALATGASVLVSRRRLQCHDLLHQVWTTRNQVAQMINLDSAQRREYITVDVRECDQSDVLSEKLREVDMLIRQAEKGIGLAIYQRSFTRKLSEALRMLSFIYDFAKLEMTKNFDPTTLVELEF